jgi:hypothetical protein
MALGTMALAETFGVLTLVSGKLFAALCFGGVIGAGVEDCFDGKEEFGEVGAGPFREAPNKAFNHEKSFTF